MTPRSILVIAALALGAAALVGWLSRAPTPLRTAKPAADAIAAENGAAFTERDVARHGVYRRASYTAFALGLALEAILLVVLARGPFRGIVDVISSRTGGWVLTVVGGAVVVTLSLRLVTLPLSFVRGYVIDRAWGLSTQELGGWAADMLKATGVATVVATVTALAFFAVVRWQPRAWWVWGWASFTLLTALFVFLWPLVIAPLFNRFTPLTDPALDARARELAAEAGVPVDEVLVADASRRTTAENAYVAGLGGSKQLVLYDTLVRSASEDEAAFVIAHELGHEVERHVLKNVAFASLTTLLSFVILALLARSSVPWRWAGASGIGDPRALPVLALLVTVGTFVAMPLASFVSRSFERRADEIALELTGDPDAAVATFRRLAYANLADLRPPPPAVWLLYTHPPVVERIEAVLADEADAS